MKITPSTLALRTPLASTAKAATRMRPLILQLQLQQKHTYATQTSLGTTGQAPKRKKKVTAFNDDGQVPWSELSAGEKAGRATQQSFNFGLILAGIALTSGITYVLWTEVLSPDGTTVQFNRAVDRVKKSPQCLDVLGDAKHIKAYGQASYNKWSRNRRIASSENTDAKGNSHMLVEFNVEGPLNKGQVHIHLVRQAGQDDYDYKYLYLDVRGHPRIYLENADTDPKNPNRSRMKFLGINWG